MREHKRIADEALDHLAELARLTKNFSGAEIEGLVKSAASFAFQRNVNVKDVGDSICVCVCVFVKGGRYGRRKGIDVMCPCVFGGGWRLRAKPFAD